jgi:hypothetical protein
LPLKKQNYTDEEIPIFDEASIYKRGVYWHFRMWLNNERKYVRKSLRNRSKTTAIEKEKEKEKEKEAYLEIFANHKMGKTYFSLTTKRRAKKRYSRNGAPKPLFEQIPALKTYTLLYT